MKHTEQCFEFMIEQKQVISNEKIRCICGLDDKILAQTKSPNEIRKTEDLVAPFVAIPLEDIDAERKRGWVNFHPETFCHRCGGVNIPSWYVDSDRFNVAMGKPIEHRWQGIICPGCFVTLHEEATGLTTTWKLMPTDAHPFRHKE